MTFFSAAPKLNAGDVRAGSIPEIPSFIKASCTGIQPFSASLRRPQPVGRMAETSSRMVSRTNCNGAAGLLATISDIAHYGCRARCPA